MAVVGLASGIHGVTAAAPGGAAPLCATQRPSTANASSLAAVLASGHDVWGERLLAAPGGPTLAGVRRLLPPLYYARGRGGRSLTDTGAYYLAFAMPKSLYGDKAFALHVADGSEIMTRRAGGRNLGIEVGERRRERYGGCLARLAPAQLASGYLPILRTAYVDGDGARYHQESFAGRVSGVRSLISFVRLSVDARSASHGRVTVRFIPSLGGLSADGNRLVSAGGTQLVFSEGGAFDGTAITYRVHGRATIVVGWVHQPAPTSDLTANEATYASARADVVRFWNAALARGTVFSVPDAPVENALRNVLIQQVVQTWRYSIGNAYEELSFAEALDSAEVMAAYGFDDVARAIVRFSLRRLPERYTNWRAGEALLASAVVSDLGSDTQLLEEATPALAAPSIVSHVSSIVRAPQVFSMRNRSRATSSAMWSRYTVRPSSGKGSLQSPVHGRREVTLRALRRRPGWPFGWKSHSELPSRSPPVGSPMGRCSSLPSCSQEATPSNSCRPRERARIGISSRRTPSPPGSFARAATMRDASCGTCSCTARVSLASCAQARIACTETASAEKSGTDQVYGLNVSRFLADNDRPDQLVLSLYGTLGAAMTPNTFVSGEAATVAPLGPTRYRTMYLPPNSGTNATFLETLRLTLVHETRGPRGAPTGLELAFATPRAWLEPGKTISVRNAPTSFGPLSYTAHSQRQSHSHLRRPDRESGAEATPTTSPRTSTLRLSTRPPAFFRTTETRERSTSLDDRDPSR